MKPSDLDEAEEGELWLVSYADMMTLIASFFILMMAFANYDPVGFNIKAEDLSKAFRKEKYKSSEEKLKFIQEEVIKYAEIAKQSKITLKEGELAITFSSSALFSDQSSDLNAQTESTLINVVEIIKQASPQARILIEGHADDTFDANRDPSFNWRIGSLRSAKVASIFERQGFVKENVVAISYGNSRMIQNSLQKDGSRDDSVAALNRRIIIRVLEPHKKQKVKMGLGIYFKDAERDVDETFPNPEMDKFEVTDKEEGE